MLLWLKNLGGAGGGAIQYPEVGGWIDFDYYAWKQRRLREEEDKRNDEIAELQAILIVEPEEKGVDIAMLQSIKAERIKVRTAEIKADAARIVETEMQQMLREDEEIIVMILSSTIH